MQNGPDHCLRLLRAQIGGRAKKNPEILFSFGNMYLVSIWLPTLQNLQWHSYTLTSCGMRPNYFHSDRSRMHLLCYCASRLPCSAGGRRIVFAFFIINFRLCIDHTLWVLVRSTHMGIGHWNLKSALVIKSWTDYNTSTHMESRNTRPESLQPIAWLVLM